MPKVEIDLEQLAAVLNAAVMSLVKPVKEENKPVKRGRGRPKKVVPTEEVAKENLKWEKIEGTPYEHKPESPTNIFNPKGFIQEVEQKRPKREYKNLFHDDGTLNANDRIPADKYPQPTEKRDAAVKYEYVCGICNRTFSAYPSQVPSAYVRLGDGKEATKPIIRCDDCLTSAVTNRINRE